MHHFFHFPPNVSLWHFDFGNKQNFVSVLFTANAASQIVKVDVTPQTGTGVNQSQACASPNKSRDIPGLTHHGLTASASVFVNNLKKAIDSIHCKFQALLVQKYNL